MYALLALIILLLSSSAEGAGPPTLDNGSIGHSGINASNIVTVSLTTASAPEQIILGVSAADLASHGTPQVATVAGCGLSWPSTPRERSIFTGFTFDPNSSLPAINTGTNVDSVSGVSTSSAPDTLYSFSSYNGNSIPGGTSCSGWSSVWSGFQYNGAVSIGVSGGAGITTALCAPVSGQTVTAWANGCGVVSANVVVADALVGTSATGCGPVAGGVKVQVRVNE